MATRLIDWIWHVRGSVPLPLGQSGEEAFDRLDPLFHESGTSHERDGDRLTFRKKAPAAQDKMSIFDGGTLEIAQGAGEGGVLRYHLTSRALLFCFLAPLLFLAFAQFTVFVGSLEKAPTAVEKVAAEAKKQAFEKKQAAIQMNPVDKFLGAPAPENKDPKKKPEEKKKHSPTPAYVFAGLFAALYLVGRILEDWLVRRLFRKSVADPEAPAAAFAYG